MSYKGVAIGMPPANVPFLANDGTVNVTWYRFLQNLYQRSGLGTPDIAMNGKIFPPGTIPPFPPNGPAFWVANTSTPPDLVVVDIFTGFELGRVQIT